MSRRLVLALVLILTGVAPASADGVWGVTRDLDQADGDGLLCDLGTGWEDGRSLSLFVNGNEYFGISISDPRWNLKQGISSHVTFKFSNGREFSFPVSSEERFHVIGQLSGEQAIGFIRHFRERWSMELIFPRGTSWSVSLRGSKQASYEWFGCYQQLRGMTDGRSRDPFGDGNGAATNPF